MKPRITISAWLAALAVMLALSACGLGGTPTVSATRPPDKTAVKTDLSELRKYITVPGTPITVKWQIVRLGPQNNDSGVPGPSTYQLTALLSYTNIEVESLKPKLIAEGGDVVLNANVLQDWFPASVQAAFIKQSDGSYKLNGARVSTEPFYRSPYLQGYAALLGAGDVLVVLIAD